MTELLPILTGLIVISALAVIASNDKKEDTKEVKEKKEKKEYEQKEDKNYKDNNFKKLFGYFKKNLSSKKKPRRYRKIYSRGKTKRNIKGEPYYKLETVSR